MLQRLHNSVSITLDGCPASPTASLFSHENLVRAWGHERIQNVLRFIQPRAVHPANLPPSPSWSMVQGGNHSGSKWSNGSGWAVQVAFLQGRLRHSQNYANSQEVLTENRDTLGTLAFWLSQVMFKVQTTCASPSVFYTRMSSANLPGPDHMTVFLPMNNHVIWLPVTWQLTITTLSRLNLRSHLHYPRSSCVWPLLQKGRGGWWQGPSTKLHLTTY